MRSLPARGRLLAPALVACVAALGSGCAWQPYVVTRAVRHVTGAKTRVHLIIPLAASLRAYRVIELRALSNQLPGRVPAAMARYLDDRIAKELGSLPSAPAIVRPVEPDLNPGAPEPPAEPTLLVDGFLDDYDAGSLPLRIIELGFNHITVTARIRLRDKASERVLGSASITAEDDRETGTTKAAIDHLASRVRTFVVTGYAQ
jgi:hypothetical protein